MFKPIYLSACILALNLTGCATIISGKTDTVGINSVPSGAQFSIKDEDGKAVTQGVTPTSVRLDRGNGFFNGQTYTIDYTKPGYENKSYKLETSLNNTYWGNLLAGGLVGMLIVDPVTGAMWDLPENVDASLASASSINDAEEPIIRPKRPKHGHKANHRRHR
jgi:uncharacterized protein YceK